MSTFYVRKDGSGTHTDIQSAIYDAVSGDTIDIGAGTFNENIDFYKSVILKGAGKDVTFVTGKLAATTFSGCSFYAGEDTITTTSTSGLIRGRSVTGTNLSAGSRVSQIISATQFKVSVATSATGIIAKTAVSVTSGSTSIVLPNVTSLVVGMKVVGTGVEALVTAINATTKTVTLSSPTTSGGSNVALSFKPARSAVTVTMPSTFSGSSIPATIQVMNVAMNGWQIKDMTITGFDNSTPSVEASGIGICSPASGSHQNWLIDNCKIIADGDSALVTSPNLASNGGTIQNCTFDGKTFTGSAPAEVPAFSSFTRQGIITAVTANSFSIQYSDMSAIVVGGFATSSFHAATGTITAISGNIATYNKTSTATVGQTVSMTITNVQFTTANVARQLVVIGNSSSVSSCLNMTFKNNSVIGQTGAVIGSNKSMFNTAVTIDTVGGLVEDNMIDGTFGAGDPNTLVSNFALRSRGTGVVVQNNTNKTSGGRGNSGFYIPNGTSTNNVTIDRLLVEVSQSASNSFVESMMEKGALKAISKVSSDAVFSNESNWKLVNYVFKHDSSSRRLVSSFRSSFDSSKKTKLKTNMKVGDKFELQKIIISKSDRTHLVLKRSEISGASSFDFTLLADGPSSSGGGGGGQPSYVWQHDFANGLLVQQTPVYPFVGGLSSGAYMMHKDAGQQGTMSFIPRIEWTTGSVNPVTLDASKNHKFRVYISEVSVGNIGNHGFIFQNNRGTTFSALTSAEVQSQYSQNGYLEFSLASSNVAEFVNYDASFTMTMPANGPEITFKVSKLEIYEV